MAGYRVRKIEHDGIGNIEPIKPRKSTIKQALKSAKAAKNPLKFLDTKKRNQFFSDFNWDEHQLKIIATLEQKLMEA